MIEVLATRLHGDLTSKGNIKEEKRGRGKEREGRWLRLSGGGREDRRGLGSRWLREASSRKQALLPVGQKGFGCPGLPETQHVDPRPDFLDRRAVSPH